MTEKFEDVTVLGHPMLFTCLRVDRDTVPQGMYMYEVRHDDDQQGEPVQIANWIMVNHWGTLISNASARESTLTAFYTPPVVIKAVYSALENMHFQTGNVLEIIIPSLIQEIGKIKKCAVAV